MNTRDLAKRARNKMLSAYYNDGRDAVSGLADGTFYFTDDGGNTHYSRIWVRYSDQVAPNNMAAVYNGNVPLQVGIPVTVKNINGTPIAFVTEHGLRRIQYNTGNNGMMPVAPHSHRRLGPNPDYVEGLRFLPLCVRPSDPVALTVYVEPGAYRWKSTQPTVWQGGDTGSLSAYVPAAGIVHFVIIALDRDTNTLAIIDGANTAGTDPLFPGLATWDEIEAITIAAKYYPLAVVHLSNGQTTITAKDITNDVRLWGMENTTGNTGGGWIVNYNAIIPTGKDAFIPGQVLIESGYILTVSGDLYIV